MDCYEHTLYSLLSSFFCYDLNINHEIHNNFQTRFVQITRLMCSICKYH